VIVVDVYEFDFTTSIVQKNNILGMVDNAHMAIADQTPDRPRDWRCLALVEQHNTAVDFFKTGISINRAALDSPKKWPDFMGKVRLNSLKAVRDLTLRLRVRPPQIRTKVGGP
jgi:hypothetical protein